MSSFTEKNKVKNVLKKCYSPSRENEGKKLKGVLKKRHRAIENSKKTGKSPQKALRPFWEKIKLNNIFKNRYGASGKK